MTFLSFQQNNLIERNNNNVVFEESDKYSDLTEDDW